jgi:hypothetical protein
MRPRALTSPPGHCRWAIAGGHISLESCGAEPELTSFDRICVLNAGDRRAQLELIVLYDNQEPVSRYKLCVGARRVRHVRFNDLIDPLPIPLDTDYSIVVTSDVPVVVQFSRQDTGSSTRASTGTLAWAM